MATLIQQSRLSESAKSEGDACEVPNGDTLHLLEEIEYWKGEVERKPDPKEVGIIIIDRLRP